MHKKSFVICLFLLIASNYISAQTHISVPLGHPVYAVLEQAQMRGLFNSPPYVKPYTRAMALSYISMILSNDDEKKFGRLTEKEREILEQFRKDFSPDRNGLDLIRGTYSSEHIWNDIYFSSEFGLGMELIFAGVYFQTAGGYNEGIFSHPSSGDFFGDLSIAPEISFMGDLGKSLSYGFSISGFIGKSQRSLLGSYQTDITSVPDDPSDLENYRAVFSEPHAYFPYTYKKRWDSFVFAPGGFSTGGMLTWPRNVSLGYTMMPELSASLLNGHVFFRFARIDREWAGTTTNGSLVLNQSAQPFLALETVIQPFSWFSFSSLTGVLEYDTQWGYENKSEVKQTSRTFQNAFSIVMLEASYKNYFNFNLGSSVIWPKRFELGYMFPLMENFLYQNNIGDFDNMALFLNLQGQYPGIGKLWFSLFLDEVNIADFNKFLEMDRMMYAFQFGGSFNIPWLPFSSVKLSYTKIEPYNYTHIHISTPWYTNPSMETNYVNAGRSLGYYLPPNSDEILVRFETLPVPSLLLSLQYQMIRHGADYGDRAVDGSSYWSELPGNRGWDVEPLRKYFLKDGAYQWMHIVKLRGEYSLTGLKIPAKVFAELGGVYSFFTDIEPNIKPNSGSPNIYKTVDTPQYPHTLRFIGMIGVKIFPKF